jgi:hypothetical protein
MKKNNWDNDLVYFLLFAAASILLGATIQVIYDILTRK